MRIAIVDDEQEFLLNLKSMISENYPEPDKLSISEFGSGEEFINDFKKNMYDVIILDIEMKELNGLETAERIRSDDSSMIIVFLTSHQEFVLQGYEVNAFRYMLKSQPEPLYRRQLSSIFDEYHQTHLTFPVQTKNAMRNISISDIVFFEIFKRMIVLHTTSEKYEFYGKLSEIEKDERLINFIKPHKSYYVNLAFIDNLEHDILVMKTKDKIPLSRKLKQSVTDKFLTFLTEGC